MKVADDISWGTLKCEWVKENKTPLSTSPVVKLYFNISHNTSIRSLASWSGRSGGEKATEFVVHTNEQVDSYTLDAENNGYVARGQLLYAL